MRLIGLGWLYVPGGDAAVMMQRPFAGNLLTSDPVRYARNAAVLEAEPTLGARLADRGLGRRGLPRDERVRRVRLSGKHPPADPDRRRRPGRRSSRPPAIEDFAVRLRAGSHLIVPGARHEMLMEQDRFRAQFWAAFDAFVPGTPLFG